MTNLRSTANLVKSILEENEQSRNSDSFLYLQLLKKKNIDLQNLTVAEFLLHMKELDAPPFESVRRARQKLQAKYPELAATAKVKEARAEQEQEYYAFAKCGDL